MCIFGQDRVCSTEGVRVETEAVWRVAPPLADPAGLTRGDFGGIIWALPDSYITPYRRSKEAAFVPSNQHTLAKVA
jgi:hypothetical protein